jgi:L-threonylcarbamoyladenylate synthase
MPAVFLDRDGTIIEDRGYLRSPAEVECFSDTVESLRLLQRVFKLFIVTNQPGIAERAIKPADVAAVHDFILEHLARFGIRIERIYCCPHRRSDGCRCIKPKPHYLRRAAREHGIDLKKSFVIGDHPHDVEFARNGGVTGIYVLTGHGARHRAELPSDALVAAGIQEATAMILAIAEQRVRRETLETQLAQAAQVLRQGGVVAVPTETVYGLAANALDAQAVARVFEIKRRPRFDPLIVHVADAEQARTVTADFPPAAEELARRFWPGPLTMVLPRSRGIPEIVTSGLPTVAVRVPDHPVALALIRQAGVPLAAPSANPFGRVSPTTARHVRDQLAHEVDFVLDGGPCRIGIESTIISLTGTKPVLLRTGGLSVEEVEEVIGPVERPLPDPDRPTAPGQLQRHYSPRTPLVLLGRDVPPADKVRAGLLSFRLPSSTEGFEAVEVLSPEGDLREAAAGLFAALHRLDAQGLDVILAEPVPHVGLGLAINDRLRRAAHTSPVGGASRDPA